MAVLKVANPRDLSSKRVKIKREAVLSESEENDSGDSGDSDCFEVDSRGNKPTTSKATKAQPAKKLKQSEAQQIQAYIDQFQDQFDHKLNNQYRELNKQQRGMLEDFKELKKVPIF